MIRFKWMNDEVMEIWHGTDLIISVNHDEHGWAGMQAAEATATKLASLLGIETKVEGGPNL